MSIDSGTGLISGLVNYYAAAASPYSVEITVDDGNGGTDTDTFTWTISNVPTTDPYVVANTGGGNGGDDLLTEVDPLDLDPVTNEVDIGTGTGTTTCSEWRSSHSPESCMPPTVTSWGPSTSTPACSPPSVPSGRETAFREPSPSMTCEAWRSIPSPASCSPCIIKRATRT